MSDMIVGRVGADPQTEFSSYEFEAVMMMADLVVDGTTGSSLIGVNQEGVEVGLAEEAELYSRSIQTFRDGDSEQLAMAMVTAYREVMAEPLEAALDSWKMDHVLAGRDVTFTHEEVSAAVAVKSMWRAGANPDPAGVALSVDEAFMAEQVGAQLIMDTSVVLSAWFRFETMLDLAGMLGEGIAFTHS